jgi:hypothetical protein
MDAAPLPAGRPKAKRRKAPGQVALAGFIIPGDDKHEPCDTDQDQEFHHADPPTSVRGSNAPSGGLFQFGSRGQLVTFATSCLPQDRGLSRSRRNRGFAFNKWSDLVMGRICACSLSALSFVQQQFADIDRAFTPLTKLLVRMVAGGGAWSFDALIEKEV